MTWTHPTLTDTHPPEAHETQLDAADKVHQYYKAQEAAAGEQRGQGQQYAPPPQQQQYQPPPQQYQQPPQQYQQPPQQQYQQQPQYQQPPPQQYAPQEQQQQSSGPGLGSTMAASAAGAGGAMLLGNLLSVS